MILLQTSLWTLYFLGIVFSLVEEKYHFHQVSLYKILMSYTLILGGVIPLLVLALIYLKMPKFNNRYINELSTKSKKDGILALIIAPVCLLTVVYQTQFWLPVLLLILFHIYSTRYFYINKLSTVGMQSWRLVVSATGLISLISYNLS